MSDFTLDQYEEYLDSFHAWGHEFFERPLTFEQFEELSADEEQIAILEECGELTQEQKRRRDEIEKLTLTHESYLGGDPIGRRYKR